MNKERTGIFKVYFALVTISAMLILPAAAVALDIHNINLTVTEYRFGGEPDDDPYEFSCGVSGNDITAVTMETPGGVVHALEAWTTAQYNWGFSFDDLTLAELGTMFPPGDYTFTFNGETDSVTLKHGPTKPTDFANIMYPVHESTDVPLNPKFTWGDCSTYGEALTTAVAEEEGDMIDMVYLGDIGRTSWTVGPLNPGRLHWLEVSVITGTTPFNKSTTNSDTFDYYNFFENCSGVYFTTATVKEFELKFKGDGYFANEYDPATGDLVFSPAGGADLLNVSHLGLSEVVWELRVTPPPGSEEDPAFAFRSGTFTITGANGDSLTGSYSDFQMGTGTYTLEWLFEGGTGRFNGASGTGHTDGLVDLDTGYAKFKFTGDITVPKEKGKK